MTNQKLTGKQNRFLRSKAHSLKPIVIIGTDRLTPGVLEHIDQALEQHELMKVRVTDAERGEAAAIAQQITEATGAHVAQRVGHTLVLYRQRKEGKPTLRLPKGAAQD